MKLQKRLAARALNCSPERVRFDPEQLKEIKEAITTFDIQRLINQGTITRVQKTGISRFRAKRRANQRRKGRQSGYGSRKGKAGARQDPKQKWMRGVRVQRELIKTLKDKDHIGNNAYRELYNKVKGGFFRSTKHIKLYIDENNLVKK